MLKIVIRTYPVGKTTEQSSRKVQRSPFTRWTLINHFGIYTLSIIVVADPDRVAAVSTIAVLGVLATSSSAGILVMTGNEEGHTC